MSEKTGPELKLAVRRTLYVFVGLLLCITLMVVASQLNLGHHTLNIVLALGIAAVQASLVAGYLMQLISERKMVLGILALTAVLFLGLILLIIESYADHTSAFFH